MSEARHSQIWRTILVLTAVSLFAFPAQAKYSGGAGEPNDPYQIATAADLIALGEAPEDYDKHFILTADIDLDPNLPGRKVFDKAVIAADTDPVKEGFQGTRFSGFFDGNGHMISHLTITGESYLGLFGYLSWAQVRDLRLVDVVIAGSGVLVGGLAGYSEGSLTLCQSTGTVSGRQEVGGLVGCNAGSSSMNYSTATVSGRAYLGGLVGSNWRGTLTHCYSSGPVTGTGSSVGGLVGLNVGTVTQCYSTGTVSGSSGVGGLLGGSEGFTTGCYSTGAVSGGSAVGGLVGHVYSDASILCSVWDVQTSGVSGSAGGAGLTTAEMMDPTLLGLNGFAGDPNWVLDPGHDYPRLAWEGTPGDIIPEPDLHWLVGDGTAENPYRLDTADSLIRLGKASALWDRHFLLTSDIDLDPSLPGGRVFGQAVVPDFTGVFDGDGHTISHLTIEGGGWLGLFGRLGRWPATAKVRNLGVVDVNIVGSGDYIGGLVGLNVRAGVTGCHTTGVVTGNGDFVGGVVGYNSYTVTQCYSTAAVTGGGKYVGGLVGYDEGTVTQCYSTGTVDGNDDVGGLVGYHAGGTVTQCYSTAAVTGSSNCVGGLVGYNSSSVTHCYSTGAVDGNDYIGGLVGGGGGAFASYCYSTGTVSGAGANVGGLLGCGPAYASFWDTQTSGRATSAGGTGLTTAEMKKAATFLLVWGTCANQGIWMIDDGHGYPRLTWEQTPGTLLGIRLSDFLAGSGTEDDPYLLYTVQDIQTMASFSCEQDKHFRLMFLQGAGTADSPYLVSTAEQLDMIGMLPREWDKHYKLTSDIDLSAFDGKDGRPAFHILGDAYEAHSMWGGIWLDGTPFTGVFDGDGHTISHLTVKTSWGSAGLFSGLRAPGEVKNLGVMDVNITSSSPDPDDDIEYFGPVGGLVGYNTGTVTRCYSTGTVATTVYYYAVGGLVGRNSGSLSQCYSAAVAVGVSGSVGGLAGYNSGTVSRCYSAGPVSGSQNVGGLVGTNGSGTVTQCYSTGTVAGSGQYIGGLVGQNSRDVLQSFWDIETSGQSTSSGGTGKTTAEMQTANTFLDAGWDFVGEMANGTEDIWWINEGKDYPRLWWELIPEN